MTADPDDPTTVLATGDPLLLGLAKSLLDDAGIIYVTKGEALQEVIGVGRFGIGMNPIAGPVELQVRSEDAGEARRIVSDLDEGKSDDTGSDPG